MEFFCNFIWEKGLREKNEDSLCVRQITKDGTNYLLAVVCDGIGGLKEGENASSFVVNCMLEYFKELIRGKRSLSDRRIRNSLKRQLFRCHKTLQRYGKKKEIQLGTTMSLLFIVGRSGYLFHVGDSAVFVGKRILKRITPIQQSQSGALLQAIGTGKNPILFYKKIIVKNGMVFLLASDGFYRKSEERICTKGWIRQIVCEEKCIGEVLASIKGDVQKSGEKDNISAICVKVHQNRHHR